ncbi:MAG: OmpA family protein [Myxococcales bacterium]|nr:OmpA family protein [Myxococcales bacterium]
MIRQRTFNSFRLISVLIAALVSTSVEAQGANFNGGVGADAHLFRPAIDSKGYISTNGTSVLGDGDYSFGLVLDLGLGIMPYRAFEFDENAAVEFDADGIGQDGFSRTDHLVNTAITGTLHFNYGIANRAVVGVQVPIMVLQGPSAVVPGIYNDDDVPAGLDSQGLGNVTLHGKIRLLRHEANAFGVAALLQLELPTGDASEFRGEPGFAAWPRLAVEWVPAPAFRIGVNGGYRFNSGDGAILPFDGQVSPVNRLMGMPSGSLLNPGMCDGSMGETTNATCPGPVTGATDVEYNDLVTASAAMSFRFAKSAALVGDVYMGKVMDDASAGTLGAEAIGGLKLFVEDNSYLVLAGGVGVLESVNSADIRGVLGFIFEPSIGDRDGDGYKDDVDACPDEPEDFDNFEDEEGCPDPDNDRDGILDVDDECPLVPEDHDGDSDKDGCPEGNIGDRDGDGILDNVDECPDDPEDRDGFQDEEGCPDPDNDSDGILDVDDLCPNDPEDKDDFEDADGCPDPDNDKDRILDVDDSCPNDPESYNGFEDEDGCPDRGNVIIEENEIIILEKIYFATDSAEILSKSFPIVDAVAATLMGNPQITMIEIQGHADERGADDYNIRLTSDRAASVVQALGQRGVDMNRMRSAGYGERCPVDAASNKEAWEKNRRVEFKILRTDSGPTGVEVACPAGLELVPKD